MILTHTNDIFLFLIFLGFIAWVVGNGFNTKQTFPTFLNAGGKIHWLTICSSIICTNIAFEYILGSAGNGFSIGFAYASYEWGAILVMVFTALYFIPKFIQVGVLTLPEYLEHRFSKSTRVLMGVLFVCLQVGMLLPSLAANAIFLEQVVDIPKIISITGIAGIGSVVLLAGGMKSKLKVDIVVFFLFIIASSLIIVLGLIKVEGIENFLHNASGRMTLLLPETHPVLPWTSVVIGGLWVLHVKYWGFFQPIAQTALASDSLSQTQKGLLAATTLKLITPFFILLPGILAFELYSSEINSPDMAFAVYIKNIVPEGFMGLFAIAYIGIMITCYMGYLQASASIFSLDVIDPILTKFNVKADKVLLTRISVLTLTLIASFMTYNLKLHGTIFEITQMLLCSIAPISTAVFLFAIFSRRTPVFAPIVTIVLGIPVFALVKSQLNLSLLNLSGVTFAILFAFMGLARMFFYIPQPKQMPEKFEVKFERNLVVAIWSIFIVTTLTGLYTIFI